MPVEESESDERSGSTGSREAARDPAEGSSAPSPDPRSAARGTGDPDALRTVLTESRRLGFLGPGPIEDHIAHARGFVRVVRDAEEVLDLGSGGGLPGLVLVGELPATRFVLLDAAARRCEFLAWAVEHLGASDRVEVVCGRAEALAHEPGLRERFPAVVARSFGAPAVTAECAAGFLAGPGSRLLVSEPPAADPARWPEQGLIGLGLRPAERVATSGATIQILEMVTELSENVPRRIGVPAKRPRF